MVKSMNRMLKMMVLLSFLAVLATARHSRGLREHEYDESLPKPILSHPLHVDRSSRRLRRKLLRSDVLAPLYPGYGTHYVYIYVGTPPQRQSLIIDTASPMTAFPCVPCLNCGTHTDPYFQISNSSTASVPKCLHNTNCPVSQIYNEGSTWHGFKVTDKVWVGDSEIGAIPYAPSFSTDFTFACQSQVTGIFRSQLADGLFGLADVEDTVPHQFFQKNLTQSRIFALCYRVGGGILTLGGVDQSIHHNHKLLYAKLDKRPNGKYGVFIDYVRIRDLKNPHINQTVAATPSQYLGTTGAIIDSGSTDTVLPASLAKAFEQTFEKSTGLKFSPGSFSLTEADLNKMPEIVIGLAGVNAHEVVEIALPVSSYLESLGDGKYSYRIHLTSTTGSLLGANFLTGYNVVFDAAGDRIGFAKSTCNYEELVPIVTPSPSAQPTPIPGSDTDGKEDQKKCDAKRYTAYTACTAYCNKNESAYRVQGSQDYMNECKDENIQSKTCYENCSFHQVAKGPIPCLDQPWSECTHGCIKSRLVVPPKEQVMVEGKCNYRYQTATCYSGLCPRQDGDYLVYLDMRVRIEPYRWSYVHTEYFYTALSNVLKVYIHNIELLHSAHNEYASSSKLHFQIRIKAKDYKDSIALHDAADKVVVKCRRFDFGAQMLSALNDVSSWVDGNDIARFAWLLPADLEVLSAVAIPIGEIRDPTGTESNGAGSNKDDDSNSPTINTFGYFVLGIAVAAMVIIVVLLYLHFKLREEYALLSKDKSSISQSSHTLRKLWSKFATFAAKNFTSNGKSSGGSGGASKDSDQRVLELSRIRHEQEQQLSRMGLMHGGIADDDDELSDEGN